jgi:hypothetical protein
VLAVVEETLELWDGRILESDVKILQVVWFLLLYPLSPFCKTLVEYLIVIAFSKSHQEGIFRLIVGKAVYGITMLKQSTHYSYILSFQSQIQRMVVRQRLGTSCLMLEQKSYLFKVLF